MQIREHTLTSECAHNLYGHKLNLSHDCQGQINHLVIEARIDQLILTGKTQRSSSTEDNPGSSNRNPFELPDSEAIFEKLNSLLRYIPVKF